VTWPTAGRRRQRDDESGIVLSFIQHEDFFHGNTENDRQTQRQANGGIVSAFFNGEEK